jgi:hypothetical protein
MQAASLTRVSLRAGPYTFTYVTYDPPSDVLYATIGPPRPGTRERTPESHYLRFDGTGRFSGIIFMSPRVQLEREGGVYVSLPEGDRVRVQGVESLVREVEAG